MGFVGFCFRNSRNIRNLIAVAHLCVCVSLIHLFRSCQMASKVTNACDCVTISSLQNCSFLQTSDGSVWFHFVSFRFFSFLLVWNHFESFVPCTRIVSSLRRVATTSNCDQWSFQTNRRDVNKLRRYHSQGFGRRGSQTNAHSAIESKWPASLLTRRPKKSSPADADS